MKHIKVLIWALGLVLMVGLALYIILTKSGLLTTQGSAEGTTITALHMESFPAGTQLGPGMTGTETTSFKIGEIAVLSGTVVTDGKVSSSFRIFKDGNTVGQEQTCVEIKGSGGFGCG